MMKKLLIVLTVLAMATVANAALKISVNGVVDPPDTQIVLKPSEFATIDIHATETALSIMVMQGPGSLDVSNLTFKWEQSNATVLNDPDLKAALEEMGYVGITGMLSIDVVDASEPYTIPNGLVIDGIKFHCERYPGDVTLTLMDGSANVFDSQVIHQIPEPVTFALLGLGGLFLRRRK